MRVIELKKSIIALDLFNHNLEEWIMIGQIVFIRYCDQDEQRELARDFCYNRLHEIHTKYPYEKTIFNLILFVLTPCCDSR